MFLRQSTASQEILLGPFVDDTDGKTAETGLTIANTDIKIHKSGATTLASKNSGGATHVSNGNYYAVLDATDTNTVGNLEIIVQVAGALAVRREYAVLEEVVFDAIVAASAALDVSSVTGAVGSVTGNVGGNVTGSVGSVAAGGITASSIAADAIGASELAADAVTEIQSGLATAAALATVSAFVDTEVASILAAVDTEVASVLAAVDTEVAAIKAKTDLIPASPAAVGSAMTLDLNQALDLSPTADTVGDALMAAVAQGFGKWTLVGTTLTLYAHDGTTVVRTFTLNSASDPTSRT